MSLETSLLGLLASPQLIDLQSQLTRPNIFSLAGKLRSEGLHSRILAWLFDPSAWHGFGTTALGHFLSWLSSKKAGAMLPYGGVCDLSRIKVRREEAAEGGAIDILTIDTGRECLVGIENKIDAEEQPDQVPRYARGLDARFPRYAIVVVFLTPDGREPKTVPKAWNWVVTAPSGKKVPVVAVSYSEILRILRQVMCDLSDKNDQDPRAKQILADYVWVLQREIVVSDDRFKDLREPLLRDYRDAIRFLAGYTGDDQDALWQEVVTAVTPALGSDWKVEHRIPNRVLVYRAEWREKFGLDVESRPLVHIKCWFKQGEDDEEDQLKVDATLRIRFSKVVDDDRGRTLAKRLARRLLENNDGAVKGKALDRVKELSQGKVKDASLRISSRQLRESRPDEQVSEVSKFIEEAIAKWEGFVSKSIREV